MFTSAHAPPASAASPAPAAAAAATKLGGSFELSSLFKPAVSGAIYVPIDYAVHTVRGKTPKPLLSKETAILAGKQAGCSLVSDLTAGALIDMIPSDGVKTAIGTLARPLVTGVYHELLDLAIGPKKSWLERGFDAAESAVSDLGAIMLVDHRKN